MEMDIRFVMELIFIILMAMGLFYLYRRDRIKKKESKRNDLKNMLRDHDDTDD